MMIHDRPDSGLRSRFHTTALGLSGLIALVSPACESRPRSVVPVLIEGKVTLNGGAWPRAGILTFEPVDPGGKLGVALFETDGSFNLISEDLKEGLYPGRYRIGVSCWAVEPTVDASGRLQGGENCVPEPYRLPKTSSLNLTVRPGFSPTKILLDLKTPTPPNG